MSKALEKKKVVKAIKTKLAGRLQHVAMAWLKKKMPYRHGSKAYAKAYPKRMVDVHQKTLMLKMKRKGCSFREIEETFHLRPASGNDAYRCIAEAKTLERKQVKRSKKVAA